MKLFRQEISPNGRTRIYFFNHKIFSYRSRLNYLYYHVRNKLQTDYRWTSFRKYIVADFIANKYFYENFDKPALLKNLDTESLKNITSVLSKYEYLANGGTYWDFLSDTELTTYHNTTLANFFHSIQTKLQDNQYIYIYKDFKLPIYHIEPSVFLDEHGLRKVNTSLVHNEDTIIDAGCFIADSVLIFRKYFPHNHIISFEAAKENYRLAQKTLQLNNIQNVTLENTALGDREGEIYINEYGESATQTLEQKYSDNAIRCPLTTLDNYVKQHNIKKVGFIKVDIEGAEQSFLHGALETIKRDRPIMLISIYHNYSDLVHIKPYIESLNLNYKLSIHKPIECMFSEILLICEPND